MSDYTYDLIVASASRPHLLLRTLTSLLGSVDVLPRQVIVHDDYIAEFQRYGDLEGVQRVCEYATKEIKGGPLPLVFRHDNPPLRHGPSLAWLLGADGAGLREPADFVLYTQDDHEVVRPLPIARCLDVMKAYDLYHVRFNKRATLEYKDTWQGRWYKKEFSFPVGALVSSPGARGIAMIPTTLTVSDHWYFQTSLWRTSIIAPVVRALYAAQPEAFKYRCEDQINGYLDDYYLRRHGHDARDPDLRAAYVRTFIWGKIGEDRYVQHIGGAREDWARPRDHMDAER